MKTCLPDINVWIALASDRHVHHDRAKEWFENVESEGAAFCRITQMGFLRLITNRHVMREDVLTPTRAWQAYGSLSLDDRVIFLEEPSGIEDTWRHQTQSTSSSASTWTDTYLAAFGSVRGLKIVSFDSGFKKLIGSNAIIL